MTYSPEDLRVHASRDEWAELADRELDREEPNVPWFDREWDEVELR